MMPSGGGGQFAPSPKHGAAWRWFQERTYAQMSECSTQEKLDAIETFVRETLEWAKGQDPDTRNAYEWAAAQVRRDARTRLTVYENSRRVVAAYEALPKPPEDRL